jgi:hypothetical protein
MHRASNKTLVIRHDAIGKRKMKNVFLGCTAIAVGAIATPAVAQYYPASNQTYSNPYVNQHNPYANQNNSYANDMSMRVRQLQARLDEGVRMRLISQRAARPIREEIRQIAHLERHFSTYGYSGQQRASLQQRIRIVSQQLRRADRGAQGRYAEWDREDQYGWDAHNNRGPNYGYQQHQPTQPTGIAGLINSILGGGGLQVGQRAPSGLYGVPYQHQAHFRDGNGVYYRSDGRQIYQIDARTHTVSQILPI